MIKQGLLVVVYNKDVECILDKGSNPVCKTFRRSSRRSVDVTNNLPSHDPYIPRSHSVFFDCSTPECKGVSLQSITQVTSPNLVLKSCFEQIPDTYECETIRYNYFKNIDKLLFLSTNIQNKTFYAVDCLVYSDGGRVCHKKTGAESHSELVDTGTIARPKEPNILAQDEFICEEGPNKEINCDLDPFTPFDDGLKLKQKVTFEGDILLKTGPYIAALKRNCIDTWCGYSGSITPSRRAGSRYSYEPPGGWVYTCYYAKKQQICKPLYNPNKPEHNERDWIAFVCACSVLAALDGYSQQQDSDQFHIQTDGDEDRYFIYQTHNGQYRKERRLKDGSVVGTTGWVGADGYLRLQDYIADGQGYRIYKSKTVYVGENRPIGESLNIAKTAPTDSGYGVTPAPAVQRTRAPPRVSSTTPSPPPTSHTFPAEVTVTPPPPYTHPTSTPRVFVSPNSIDSSTTYDFRPTVPPITASEASSTANPYDYDSSNTNTLDDGYYASDSTRYDVYNPNSYRHADEWQRRQPPGAKIGNGYTPQFAPYDGVAFRRNGFRYYLPKQYHEEESSDAQERTGSFGYVDPFGIRRVIYYNTAPGEGFQIRKNNRYVGHDATPYDPRPIN